MPKLGVEEPRPPLGDVPLQTQRLVLGQNEDPELPAVQTVRQGKVDDPVSPAERDGRLRALAGEGVQPSALAARQENGQHVLHAILRREKSDYAMRISASEARASPPEMSGLIVSSSTVTPHRSTR